MPYDPDLADRIRALLAGTKKLKEQKMFGGIGWTVGGNMAAGAHNDGRLMIRCAKEDFAEIISRPGADGMKRGNKDIPGWVLVDASAVSRKAALSRWVTLGREYAESLPVKKGKKPARPR